MTVMTRHRRPSWARKYQTGHMWAISECVLFKRLNTLFSKKKNTKKKDTKESTTNCSNSLAIVASQHVAVHIGDVMLDDIVQLYFLTFTCASSGSGWLHGGRIHIHCTMVQILLLHSFEPAMEPEAATIM